MSRISSEVFNASRPGYSADVAAKAAYDMTFFPKPDPRLNESQEVLLSQAVQSVIQVNGNEVRTYDWNSASSKKALLVHGVGGKCLDFSQLVPILSTNGFRVIGFDAPAHGFSKGNEVDIGDFWLCIQKLCSVYGNHFGIAVSHSFGSAALAFQMRINTLRAENLVMFAPNAVFDSVILGFMRQINAAQDVYPPLSDLTAKRFETRIKRQELWSANSTAESVKELAASGAIKNCLILHGTKDTMFAPEDSDMVAYACQPVKCDLHILESGHKSILTAKETQEIFSAFCDRVISVPLIFSSTGTDSSVVSAATGADGFYASRFKLYLTSEKEFEKIPKAQLIAPAIVYDDNDIPVKILVNNERGNVVSVSLSGEINIDILKKFIADNKGHKEKYLLWNDPVVSYITSFSSKALLRAAL